MNVICNECSGLMNFKPEEYYNPDCDILPAQKVKYIDWEKSCPFKCEHCGKIYIVRYKLTLEDRDENNL